MFQSTHNVFLSEYWGVLILFFLGIVTGGGAILVSHLLSSRRFFPNKGSAYECGIPSEGAVNQRFSVKFYLVAVSFILFDIETVFLIPWAIAFSTLLSVEGWYVFTIGGVFLLVVLLGLLYEWRKGLLDWNI